MASGQIYTLRSGATVPLIWKPQGDASGFSFPEGIWTDTRSAGGGQPTPYYATSNALKNDFGPGTQLYRTTASSSTITVMASAAKTMLVNRLSTNQQVSVNGAVVTLSPYQVSIIDTPAGRSRQSY
jgi:hypothetical protein